MITSLAPQTTSVGVPCLSIRRNKSLDSLIGKLAMEDTRARQKPLYASCPRNCYHIVDQTWVGGVVLQPLLPTPLANGVHDDPTDDFTHKRASDHPNETRHRCVHPIRGDENQAFDARWTQLGIEERLQAA